MVDSRSHPTSSVLEHLPVAERLIRIIRTFQPPPNERIALKCSVFPSQEDPAVKIFHPVLTVRALNRSAVPFDVQSVGIGTYWGAYKTTARLDGTRLTRRLNPGDVFEERFDLTKDPFPYMLRPPRWPFKTVSLIIEISDGFDTFWTRLRCDFPELRVTQFREYKVGPIREQWRRLRFRFRHFVGGPLSRR